MRKGRQFDRYQGSLLATWEIRVWIFIKTLAKYTLDRLNHWMNKSETMQYLGEYLPDLRKKPSFWSTEITISHTIQKTGMCKNENLKWKQQHKSVNVLEWDITDKDVVSFLCKEHRKFTNVYICLMHMQNTNTNSKTFTSSISG